MAAPVRELRTRPAPVPIDCTVRDVLDRVGDKWSLLVIAMLGSGTRRFTGLLREIDGISQRMLTVTLRGLERDGLVTRTVHAVVPPRVDYALTPMGRTLLDAVKPLMDWSVAHRDEVGAARNPVRRSPDADLRVAVSQTDLICFRNHRCPGADCRPVRPPSRSCPR